MAERNVVVTLTPAQARAVNAALAYADAAPEDMGLDHPSRFKALKNAHEALWQAMKKGGVEP